MARSRKAWDPRNPNRRLLEQIGWEPRLWREPDEVDLEEGRIAWYGPGGEESDYATVVKLITSPIEWDAPEYEVIEYVPLASEMDEVDEDDPPLLKRSTLVGYDMLDTALKMMSDPPVVDGDSPKVLVNIARVVAGIGVAKLAYFGGEEDQVDSVRE